MADGLERFLKNLDEGSADDLALLLRLADALEPAEEERGGVDHAHVDAEMFFVERFNLLAFAESQEAVVDEDAGQLFADGAVDERGGHGGIDAAGKSEEDATRADLGANVRDGVVDEVRHRPIALRAANAEEEILVDVDAAFGVEHLGVKLNAVEIALPILDGGKLGVLRRADGLEARRQLDQAVAVGIPDAESFRQPGEEPAGFLNAQQAVAVFAVRALRDAAAEQVAHELDAVADAEHRHAHGKDRAIRQRSIG